MYCKKDLQKYKVSPIDILTDGATEHIDRENTVFQYFRTIYVIENT